MKKIKVINLQQNGESFRPLTCEGNQNLEALLVQDANNVARVKVTALGEVSINLLSLRAYADEEFLLELGSLEGGDYDANKYLINGFQEYLYPFIKNDEVIQDKNILLDWVSNNLKEDEEVTIVTSSFNLVEEYIVIKKNDVGVSLDYYDCINCEPIKSETFWFEDFSDTPIRVFPTSCGVTASNKPNITFVNPRDNMPYSLWYYTSFNEKDAALEFLKDLFKDGILEDDIGLDSDGALWLTMDELREVN